MATTSNDSAQYLASPPEGQVQYGMDNGPNRKGELIAMAVVTTVVATTTVALRLFTRITIVRGRVSPDDCKREIVKAPKDNTDMLGRHGACGLDILYCHHCRNAHT